MKGSIKNLILALATGMTFSAVAQSTTSTTTVATEKPSNILNNISLAYSASYTGPSVTELDTTTTRDNEGNADGSINLYNSFKLKYSLSNGLTAYLQPRFSVYLDTVEDEDTYVGHNTRFGLTGWSLSDGPVSASVGVMIETADAQKEITSKDGEVTGRNIINPAVHMFNDYNITPSNNISLYSRVRWHFYDSNEIAAEKAYYDVYLEPAYVYTINDTFGLKVAWEYVMNQMNTVDSNNKAKTADPFAMQSGVGYSDIMVGAIINIGNTEINPWVSYAPENNFEDDSTIVGFYLSTTLF